MQLCCIATLYIHCLGAVVSNLVLRSGNGVRNMGVRQRLTLRPALVVILSSTFYFYVPHTFIELPPICLSFTNLDSLLNVFRVA
jgi:hypothetical protein